MKGLLPIALFFALLTPGGPAAARAGDAPPHLLRFNPFARPELSAISRSGAPSKASGGWAPVLTATLADGEKSLVNLGGVILGVGEETHGYRLLNVDVF